MHLQSILFPPNNQAPGTAQNPLLAQVLNLAQAQRLSPDQMALLRTAVASRNPGLPSRRLACSPCARSPAFKQLNLKRKPTLRTPNSSNTRLNNKRRCRVRLFLLHLRERPR